MGMGKTEFKQFNWFWVIEDMVHGKPDSGEQSSPEIDLQSLFVIRVLASVAPARNPKLVDLLDIYASSHYLCTSMSGRIGTPTWSILIHSTYILIGADV